MSVDINWISISEFDHSSVWSEKGGNNDDLTVRVGVSAK